MGAKCKPKSDESARKSEKQKQKREATKQDLNYRGLIELWPFLQSIMAEFGLAFVCKHFNFIFPMFGPWVHRHCPS